jgi:hypothetical protein
VAATDAVGPIDFLLMEFPTDRLTGEAGAALLDLVEQGTIRVLDLVVIHKDAAGKVQVMELTDPGGPAESFAFFAGARSGLLGDDDVAEAAAAMDPGRVAALLVYENTWAAPFVEAARNSGGEVIASARIPAADVMAALDALETTPA